MENIKVSHYVTIALGDIAALTLDSQGCTDEYCTCGGVRLRVNMTQADGSGASIFMPMRAWATLAAVLTRALAADQPDVLTWANDLADTMDSEEAEPPAVLDRALDAMPALLSGLAPMSEPGAQSSLGDFLQRVMQGPRSMEDFAGRWVSLPSAKKYHCIREAREIEVGGAPAIGITTHCGKDAAEWVPVMSAYPETLCKRCTTAVGVDVAGA